MVGRAWCVEEMVEGDVVGGGEAAADEEVHQEEEKVVDLVGGSTAGVVDDVVEYGRPVDEHDVAEMQIATTSHHPPAVAAVHQPRAGAGEASRRPPANAATAGGG